MVLSPFDAELGHWWFEGPGVSGLVSAKGGFDQTAFI